jgi:hypothetical protein
MGKSSGDKAAKRRKTERGKVGRVEKEYITGRVTKGVGARFRASIPEGFNFGRAMEVALELWISLPESIRLKALIGKIEPSLPDLIGAMIDEKIEEGVRTGKLLSPPPKQTPSERG